MTPNIIDLNDAKGNYRVEFSNESPAAESARLAIEDREHQFQLKMRWSLFWSAVAAVVAIGLVGAWLAIAHPLPEMARMGVGILTAVVTGALGFMTGRSSR